MSKCRRKPQHFEFLQWSGHNVDQMMGFCKGDYVLKDEKEDLRVCKPELFGALYEIEEE